MRPPLYSKFEPAHLPVAIRMLPSWFLLEEKAQLSDGIRTPRPSEPF